MPVVDIGVVRVVGVVGVIQAKIPTVTCYQEKRLSIFSININF
jgi:hypothetical protein